MVSPEGSLKISRMTQLKPAGCFRYSQLLHAHLIYRSRSQSVIIFFFSFSRLLPLMAIIALMASSFFALSLSLFLSWCLNSKRHYIWSSNLARRERIDWSILTTHEIIYSFWYNENNYERIVFVCKKKK